MCVEVLDRHDHQTTASGAGGTREQMTYRRKRSA